MKSDFYHFRIGDLACTSLCDGGMDYKLESMVKNAPRAEVESALQARGQSTEMIYTPYAYLVVDSGKQRVLVDTGAGDLSSPTWGM